MDRLTDRSKEIPLLNSDNATFWARVHEELARYEDSGLSPEECADYAKAEAEGRLIELPCNMGDKIYIIVTKRVRVYSSEFSFVKESWLTFHNLERVISGIGKTVFLTREEAEKALERSRVDGKP